MGTRTMGETKSGGGGGGGYGCLGRQGSLYNLTLHEVENQLGDLGKPLSSMNLDELLKSVWSAEANQDYDHPHPQASTSSLIHRQSSLTLTRDLSKKTVDEVWRDIQQGGHNKTSYTNNNDRKVVVSKERERQATLGEMTLEDFLVKAGIVAESNKISTTNAIDPIPIPIPIPIAFPQQTHTQWANNYQITPPQQQQNMLSVFMPLSTQHSLPTPIGATATTNTIMDDTQMSMSPSPLMSDTQTPGCKRGVATSGGGSGPVVEKTVERRQKRMIKNRESAARSRARKQAYTNELEDKVSRLEEENERLKRQKEVENVLPSVAPPEPKYQLRRTSSSSF